MGRIHDQALITKKTRRVPSPPSHPLLLTTNRLQEGDKSFGTSWPNHPQNMNQDAVKFSITDWLQTQTVYPNHYWAIPVLASVILLIILIILAKLRSKTAERLTESKELNSDLQTELDQLKSKYKDVINIDSAKEKLISEIKLLEVKFKTSESESVSSAEKLNSLKSQLKIYQEELSLIEYGFYKKHYDFDISARFKDALEAVRDKQKKLISSERAIEGDKEWKINGSDSEGAKMIKRLEKLMLRAFNGDSDSIISNISWSNADKMEAKLETAFSTVNKLADSYRISLTRDYFKLKLDELRLTFEYQLKLKAEKEEQRRIQEQIREEERAQKEIDRALKEADDEEERYSKALDRAKKEIGLASGAELEKLTEKLRLLEVQLAEAQANKERAISRAQMTKSGHVYIISNIGSFGENRFKIGMTRRLEPMDRIKELGDASVPFEFDVHAIIYTDDAPSFEGKLHEHFNHRRINKVNERKEFFEVTIEEIETVVKQYNATIEIIKEPEAKDYRQTLVLNKNE